MMNKGCVVGLVAAIVTVVATVTTIVSWSYSGNIGQWW
jgi:hypothetical protein